MRPVQCRSITPACCVSTKNRNLQAQNKQNTTATAVLRPIIQPNTGQPTLAGPPLKNQRISLQLSFTTCKLLLTATSTFGLRIR